MLVSVVIRTLNEEKYLGELLSQVQLQETPGVSVETVLVDSGSTDRTLDIAKQHGCRITHIPKAEFSFGRSLNLGCEFARGDLLVFISGHCVPTTPQWLASLIAPLVDGSCAYSYGRQLGRGTTRFSETRVFLKYFPNSSLLPQEGFFTNNANAAIKREAWAKYRFDEELTGLEDMHLAKQLVGDAEQIGYCADAVVYHIHDETWRQVMNRYEREGIALAAIMPEAGLTFREFLSCTVRSVAKDAYAALRQHRLLREAFSIIGFRFCQYWGSYRGTQIARSQAKINRRAYFYPDRHYETARAAQLSSDQDHDVVGELSDKP